MKAIYFCNSLLLESGLKAVAASINVGEAGVHNAKGFFEQKAAAENDSVAAKDKEYREEVKKKNQEKAASKSAFKDKINQFQ